LIPVTVPTIYLLSSCGSEQKQTSAGILEQSIKARNRVVPVRQRQNLYALSSPRIDSMESIPSAYVT
jgi:hypothetical protein